MNIIAQARRAGAHATTEASLLYAETPSIGVDALVAELKPAIAEETIEIVEEQEAATTRSVLLRAGGFDILVETEAAPKPRAAFVYAVDWPMLHRTFPEAEEVIRSHRAQVQITVACEYDLVAKGMGLDAANSFYARSKMAGQVADACCRLSRPVAVYWPACEMLFKPAVFTREFEIQPVSVFTRVTPFSSNRIVGGVRVVGGSTKGADFLLGKEAVLEEAPVPVDWVMSTLHSFVAQSEAQGGYLPHLGIYSPTKGDAIIVRHLDHTPEIAQPHVSLEVRRVADIGFDADHIYDQAKVQEPAIRKWDGPERRTRPRSAKPFGRRGLA